MKLFLDDIRSFPHGFDYCVRSYNACITILKCPVINWSFIDLDYDLGDDFTGLDILRFMHENGISPKRINIHSSHILGAPEMERYAKANFSVSEISANMLLYQI